MGLSHSTFSMLSAMSMGGLVMPNLKFFQPNERFVNWMNKEYGFDKYRGLYDIGAGAGHVSKLLSEQGFYPTAIDINPRDGQEFKVTIADASSYDYHAGSVAMFCRPCHGQFVEFSIAQALACKVTNILYIGLWKNLEDDLGRYAKNFALAEVNVGAEEENIWRWKKLHPPSKQAGSCMMGGTKMADLHWIKGPIRHKYDDKRLARTVRASTHIYYGIGRHYWTSLHEDDNPIWDAEFHRWLDIHDDPKHGGRIESEQCNSLLEARQWVTKTFKKWSRNRKLRLYWDGGKEVWFGKYKDGD